MIIAKYTIISTIFLLNFILYLINPMRFSTNTLLYIPLNIIYLILTILCQISIIVYIVYLNTTYPITKNIYLLIPLNMLGVFILNIIYSPPITKNYSYNVPPNYLKKKKILFILIILLILTLIILELKNIRQTYNNYFLSILVPLILYTIITYYYFTFSPRRYNLPISYTFN